MLIFDRAYYMYVCVCIYIYIDTHTLANDPPPLEDGLLGPKHVGGISQWHLWSREHLVGLTTIFVLSA